MICKNCGANVNDNAVFCGNCGATITNDQNASQGYLQPDGNQGYQSADYSNQGYQNGGYSNQGYQNGGYSDQGYQNGDYSNQGYQDQQQGVYPLGTQPNYPNASGKTPMDKKKLLYIGIPVVAFLLVVCIVIGVLSATVFGYKSAVKKYMNAFEDVDGAEMYDLTSDQFKELLSDAAAIAAASSSYSYYSDFGDLASGAVEVYYMETLEDAADSFMSRFNSRLGESYKLKYQITQSEKVEKKDIQKLNKYVGIISKDYKFTDLMYVEVSVTGTSDGREYSDDLYFILTKEGLGWKVLAAGESLGIDDISDLFDDIW